MEPYEGAEPYIFISYARKDAEQAAPLLDALSGAGYRIWYDAGIQAGAHWTETLVEKIEGCAAFCPLISRAFNASDFCFEETDYAFGEKKTIVPVYLEAMEKKELRPLYRLLRVRQDLRLYDCADASQFAERLGREQAFAPCKVPEWHKVGEIQWRFADGVLTIARNEEMPRIYRFGSIPAYQYDSVHKESTAPWMAHRKKIVSVVIENNIDIIGDFAFLNCENLISVRISNSVAKIGVGVFRGCNSLTDIHIPNNVTQIGDFAFDDCESLTDVHIPHSVSKISDGTFRDCINLINVCIPEGVTEIGWIAFGQCNRLAHMRIPDSVTKIGILAFYKCDSLKSVEIPAGAQVGKGYFSDIGIPVTRRGVTRTPDEKNA